MFMFPFPLLLSLGIINTYKERAGAGEDTVQFWKLEEADQLEQGLFADSTEWNLVV